MKLECQCIIIIYCWKSCNYSSHHAFIRLSNPLTECLHLRPAPPASITLLSSAAARALRRVSQIQKWENIVSSLWSLNKSSGDVICAWKLNTKYSLWYASQYFLFIRSNISCNFDFTRQFELLRRCLFSVSKTRQGLAYCSSWVINCKDALRFPGFYFSALPTKTKQSQK